LLQLSKNYFPKYIYFFEALYYQSTLTI